MDKSLEFISFSTDSKTILRFDGSISANLKIQLEWQL